MTTTATLAEDAPAVVLTIDQLLALDDEDYADYVEDVLGLGAAWNALNQAPVVRRTLKAIGRLEHDLGRALIANRRGMSPSELREWQVLVGNPTKASIHQRRRGTERAARNAREQELHDQRRAYRDKVGRLGAAIREHQYALLESAVEPEKHDRALWALLDDVSVYFKGAQCTVADALKQDLFVVEGGQS
jgi:hypothetical protein